MLQLIFSSPVNSSLVPDAFTADAATKNPNIANITPATSPDKKLSRNAIAIVVYDVLRTAQETLRSEKKYGGNDAARLHLHTLIQQVEASMDRLAIGGKGSDAIASQRDHKEILATLRSIAEIRQLTARGLPLASEIPAVYSGIKKSAIKEGGGRIQAREDAVLMQEAQTLSPDALGKRGAGLAARNEHRQAALFYVAADIKKGANDTNPVHLIQTCKSLLAMGHAAEAMEGLDIAADQLLRAPMTKNAAYLTHEIKSLTLQANTAVYTGDSRRDEVDNHLSQSNIGIQLSEQVEMHRLWLSTWIADNSTDYDGIITDLAKVQHETTLVRTESQQETIKINRDLRDSRITEKLVAMKKQNDAIAEQKAAAKKSSWFTKLTQYLGYAISALCIVLAPLTAGFSLIGVAYMAIDLGLELGENISGVKMSVQSGITALVETIVEAVASSDTTPEGRKQCADIIAMVLGFIIQIAAVILTFKLTFFKKPKAVVNAAAEADTFATQTAKQVAAQSGSLENASVRTMEKTSEVSEQLQKSVRSENSIVSRAKNLKKSIQKFKLYGLEQQELNAYNKQVGKYALPFIAGSDVVRGGTGIAAGSYAVLSANKGAEVVSADVQRAEIENFQTRLDKYFQQYAEDLKNLVQEQQRHLGAIGDTLWANIDDRFKNLNEMFRHTHQNS